MTARQILEHTADVVDQRRNAYGPADAIMAAIAARWSLTLGRPVTASQVTLCMIERGIARNETVATTAPRGAIPFAP